MAALRVAEVTADVTAGKRGGDSFHAVVDFIYGDQPPGTAPTRASIDRNLSRAAFQDRQAAFVVLDADKAVARIVARTSPQLRDHAGNPIGTLGFFESVNRREVVREIFDAAVAWLRQRGARQIVGPMDGDTWHRYRINAGPFERPPFPLEPWNPPYYSELWADAGFRVLESYSSKWIDDVSALLPGLRPGVERSEASGVTIRSLDPNRIQQELSVVHDISSEIFRDAFLYSPISRDEFLALYAGVERMLDPELVIFATAPDGTEVGFVFAYADPRLKAVHYKTIGVRAEWRRAAVAAALSHRVYSSALKKGLPAGNHALMRDDNRSQALDQGLGSVFRRYLLCEWPA